MRRAILLSLSAACLFAQDVVLRDNRDTTLSCNTARPCEMREDSGPGSGSGNFSLDGMHNGSVTVRGWNRNEVRIRWRVTSDAYTDKDAKEIFSKVHTRLSGSRASVDGPTSSVTGWVQGMTWSVDAEILVPQKTSLRLDTHNGQILVSDIQGRVEAASHNGEVRLERVRGDVRAKTHNGAVRLTDITGAASFEAHNGMIQGRGLLGAVQGTSHNGPLNLELAGSPSATRSIDLENHNGHLVLGLPARFTGHVQTDANHGRLDSDFPITVRGRISGDRDARREFDIGSGGPSIRLRTNNGGITLKRL